MDLRFIIFLYSNINLIKISVLIKMVYLSVCLPVYLRRLAKPTASRSLKLCVRIVGSDAPKTQIFFSFDN